LTIKQLILMETAASLESLHDHKQRRRINHPLEECGYIPQCCVIDARDGVRLEQQEAVARKLSGLSSGVRGSSPIWARVAAGGLAGLPRP